MTSWTFRYIAVFFQRGQKVQVTMERDHRYRDPDDGQMTLDRIHAGTIELGIAQWEKLKELMLDCPMPTGFEYEVHEE